MYDRNNDGNPPNYDSFVRVVNALCPKFTSISVFLDGLDECTDKQQEDIITLVRDLRNPTIQLFLTGQPQVRNRVEGIDMEVGKIKIYAREDDLKKYVSQKLPRDYDLESEESFLEDLIVGAEGM